MKRVAAWASEVVTFLPVTWFLAAGTAFFGFGSFEAVAYITEGSLALAVVCGTVEASWS